METAISTINKFSWRRMMDYGIMYHDNIRVHLIIIITICILDYLCLLPFREFDTPGSFLSYSLLGLLIAFCVYSGGLMFSRRDDTLLTQVPATVGEKTTFQIIYSLLFIPAVVYSIWYVENLIGGMLLEGGNVETGIRESAILKVGFEITPSMIAATIFNTACQTTFIIMLVLLVVIKSKKHRMLLGILTPIIVLLLIGVIAGIYGFISAFCGLEKSELMANPDDFSQLIIKEITMIGYVIDTILLLVSGFLAYCIYRHNKTHQVA